MKQYLMLVDEVGMAKLAGVFREDVKFIEVEGMDMPNMGYQMLLTPVKKALSNAELPVQQPVEEAVNTESPDV